MFSLRFRVKKSSYHERTLMEPQKVSVLLNRARMSVQTVWSGSCYQVTKKTFIGKIPKNWIRTLLASPCLTYAKPGVIQLTERHFKHRHAADLKVSRLHKNVRLISTHAWQISLFQVFRSWGRRRDMWAEQKAGGGVGDFAPHSTIQTPGTGYWQISVSALTRLTSIKIWCLGKEKVAVVCCCGMVNRVE